MKVENAIDERNKEEIYYEVLFSLQLQNNRPIENEEELKKIIKKLNAPRDFWRPHNLNSYLCMQ
jgi:hypothetical protein